MDLRIVVDTAEHFAVQGYSSQVGEKSFTFGAYGLVLFGAFQLSRRTDAWGRLTWPVFGAGTLLFVWFIASILTTGGIRFDLDLDRAHGVWTTQAVYPKEPGEYYEPPVTRPFSDVLRVDMTASQGKGGDSPENQRILITLKSGETFQPFEGEDRGSANEYLVLDRMQKIMVGR